MALMLVLERRADRRRSAHDRPSTPLCERSAIKMKNDGERFPGDYGKKPR
jgi:hypothetical protein